MDTTELNDKIKLAARLKHISMDLERQIIAQVRDQIIFIHNDISYEARKAKAMNAASIIAHLTDALMDNRQLRDEVIAEIDKAEGRVAA